MDARKKPELLLPAGSLEVLKIAVNYGADAVYIGGGMYGLRAKARNFSMEEMAQGIAYAHAHDVRVYVTANITAHNRDLTGVRAYFGELREIRPDALIISDPGVFELAKEFLPETELHISTQANNVNYMTFRFWHRLGAKRVVSARELSLEEIGELRRNIPEDLEIETFVHGAMCISYSGRCLLSNYFTGRDANLDACTHPCRWKYYVMEETRPGEYLPVFENERGTYIFNSRDLCMIEHIPELVAAGIDSFKIEGRMKTALYVAATGRQSTTILKARKNTGRVCRITGKKCPSVPAAATRQAFSLVRREAARRPMKAMNIKRNTHILAFRLRLQRTEGSLWNRGISSVSAIPWS